MGPNLTSISFSILYDLPLNLKLHIMLLFCNKEGVICYEKAIVTGLDTCTEPGVQHNNMYGSSGE